MHKGGGQGKLTQAVISKKVNGRGGCTTWAKRERENEEGLKRQSNNDFNTEEAKERSVQH